MGAAVEYSDDFERIQGLPVRSIVRARGEELADELTPLLVTERGRTHSYESIGGRRVEVAKPSRLNWLQAYSIHEAVAQGGAYLQLPVGSGKTLLTFLLSYIFDALKPVLVVPEALIEKTNIEFQQYRTHWKLHDHPTRIIGLRQLTQDGNVDMLAEYKADLYLLDEVDMLSNQNSSMAKRLARDIDKRNVRTVAMTGTGGRFSILTFTHLITWALKESAPVPLVEYTGGEREVEVWASALDEKTPGDWGSGKRRVRPGVLTDLIEVTEDDDPDVNDFTELGYARAAFRKRLNSTEGCIISDEDSCDKALRVELATCVSDTAIERAFREFRLNVLPDGDVIADSLSRWAQAKALGRGYYRRWVVPPPDWWNEPRKAYAKLCAKIIQRTAWTEKPLDTRKAVHREFPNHPIVAEWEEVKDEWEGETEPVWISGSVVDEVAAAAHREHCIIWTESLPFGEALADATGLPFYGAQGLTVGGASIERDTGSTSVILSTGSNMRGRNLQDRWHQNEIVGCVQSARYNEQLLGRTHRFGQRRDVRARVRLTSGDSQYSFDRALIEARFVLQTQGHRQKLLRANIARCKLPKGSRWVSKPAE